jgi:hypothetical protein
MRLEVIEGDYNLSVRTDFIYHQQIAWARGIEGGRAAGHRFGVKAISARDQPGAI